MRKNILFFVLVLVLSLATSPYFGNWYDKFSPQYGGWMTSKNDAVSFAGFFVAFVFFQTFIFGLISIKTNKYWFTIPMVPVILLWLGADFPHIYIPVILSLIGFALAWILRKIFVRHLNPPMIINK